MDEKRQKKPTRAASADGKKVEDRKDDCGGIEAPMANPITRKPEQLMEEILSPENLKRAYEKVKKNGGSPGVDGVSVEDLKNYLAANWKGIRKQLLEGKYKPKAVKRVEIPKPGGGIRQLGIPTVIDRFLQQAILQRLQPEWDPTFSENSYGFRPRRSQHQAVNKAKEYIQSGMHYVVDLDLEKFFDKVNHDILMSRVAKRVEDKRVLKTIRAYLNAGIMENGLVQPASEGVPQGGPLSPLLSNLLLDELDRELEKRKLSFVRYADDCNVYVASERAGLRVKESLTKFLSKRLRLKVNEAKSGVGKPWTRKFLGFSFTTELKLRVADQALSKAKDKLRKLTHRTGNRSLEKAVTDTAKYLRSWWAYFRHCGDQRTITLLARHARRRLRQLAWKQWKTKAKRKRELLKRHVPYVLACKIAGTSWGPWRTSKGLAMSYALPNAYFKTLGLDF